MQPISSDSELDLNPAPHFLPHLYLRSAEVRNAYDAFQDDVTPPLSRSTSPCPSDTELPSEPRESDPTRMIPPQTQSIDAAPPSDEQLGLPSALSVAMDQIPAASRLLTFAMYQAPHLALITRFPRAKIATAFAHTLNMRRAMGGARAVLLVARNASTARQWQQHLSLSLDEVKVTIFRTARAARDATLNSLRTEQFPGVIIVADKALRNVQLWNDMCAALKQNRVVSKWQLAVSEIRGNDASLNLYHSPFRMVADKQADRGLMLMCSDDVARARKEQVSKEAVSSFVRSQLPSMSSTNSDAMWVTPESILVTKTTPEAILSEKKSPVNKEPEANCLHDTISPMRDAYNGRPRRKPLETTTYPKRGQQGCQQPPPNTTRTQRPAARSMPRTVPVPSHTRQAQEDEIMKDVLQLEKEQTNLNARRTATNRGATNNMQTQEEVERRPRSDLRSIRQSTSKHSSVTHSRSVRRSTSRDRVSVKGLDRRSFSIIDVSDDSDSGDEWFTPPSKIIPSPLLPDKANPSSDEDNWRTPFTSRKQRTASSRAGSRRAQQRLNRRSIDNTFEDENHDGVSSTFSRNGRIEKSHVECEAPNMPVRRKLTTTWAKTPPQRTAFEKEGTTRGTISRRRRVSNETRTGGGSRDQPLARVENMRVPSQTRGKKLNRNAIPKETRSSRGSSTPIEVSQQRSRSKAPTGNRRNITFIQIPDSDIEVIDCDVDVIDLCSDEEELGFEPHQRPQERTRIRSGIAPHRKSPRNNSNACTRVRNGTTPHQLDQRRRQEPTDQRGCARSSSVEFVGATDNQSLILSGVMKLNAHTSLTEDQRRQFNKWLRKAQAAEARGPEGYSVAIRLYTKCLGLCDENDYLTSRILSLSHETRVLSLKDFAQHGSSSRIAKRPRSPRNRRRRRSGST